MKHPPLSDSDVKLLRDHLSARLSLAVEGQRLTVSQESVDSFLAGFLKDHPDFKNYRRGKVTRSQARKIRTSIADEFNAVAAKSPIPDLPFQARELEEKSARPQRRLIMASPEKIAKGWSVRDRFNFFDKWYCLRHALVKAGAHVEIMRPSYDLHHEDRIREVYTRDRYIMIGDTAYLPDPRVVDTINISNSEGYKGEIKQIRAALKKRGVKTVTVKGTWLEGGNIVRHYSSRTLFAGMDQFNTSEHLQRLLDAINRTQKKKWSAVPVPLVKRDPFYHLDTGMSEELPRGEVIICPDVTDRDTYKKIREVVGEKNIIELSEYEATDLVTNMIDVGNTLIMTGSYCVPRELAERGYNVVTPADYGRISFEFGQGGAHCMTNDLRSVRRAP